MRLFSGCCFLILGQLLAPAFAKAGNPYYRAEVTYAFADHPIPAVEFESAKGPVLDGLKLKNSGDQPVVLLEPVEGTIEWNYQKKSEWVKSVFSALEEGGSKVLEANWREDQPFVDEKATRFLMEKLGARPSLLFKGGKVYGAFPLKRTGPESPSLSWTELKEQPRQNMSPEFFPDPNLDAQPKEGKIPTPISVFSDVLISKGQAFPVKSIVLYSLAERETVETGEFCGTDTSRYGYDVDREIPATKKEITFAITYAFCYLTGLFFIFIYAYRGWQWLIRVPNKRAKLGRGP